MFCLLILHVVWFKAMLKIGYTFLTTGVGADKVNDLQASTKAPPEVKSPIQSPAKLQRELPLKLD